MNKCDADNMMTLKQPCMSPLYGLCIALVIILSFIFSLPVYANDGWQYKVDLGYSQRSDELTLRQDGQLSGTLTGNTSALTLKPNDVEQLQFNYRFISDNYWYIKGHFHTGRVYSGSMQQTSYIDGQANSPWASYQATGLRGSTGDRSFAMGRQMRWQQDQYRFAITPLLGYARSYQDLQTTGGKQTTCNATGGQICLLGASVSNNEAGHFYSIWRGPWYGLDMRLNHQHWTWSLAWEYHRIHYDGSMKWQGDQTLSATQSTSQSGLGYGNRFVAGVAYWIDNSFVNLQMSQSRFKLTDGTTESTSTAGVANSQPIQSLIWENRAVTLSYTHLF